MIKRTIEIKYQEEKYISNTANTFLIEYALEHAKEKNTGLNDAKDKSSL